MYIYDIHISFVIPLLDHIGPRWSIFQREKNHVGHKGSMPMIPLGHECSFTRYLRGFTGFTMVHQGCRVFDS